jgi:hypothetical protein
VGSSASSAGRFRDALRVVLGFVVVEDEGTFLEPTFGSAARAVIPSSGT